VFSDDVIMLSSEFGIKCAELQNVIISVTLIKKCYSNI